VTAVAAHHGQITHAAAVAATRWMSTRRTVTMPGTGIGMSPPGLSPGVLKTADSPISNITAPTASARECGHKAHGTATQAISSVRNRRAPRASLCPGRLWVVTVVTVVVCRQVGCCRKGLRRLPAGRGR